MGTERKLHMLAADRRAQAAITALASVPRPIAALARSTLRQQLEAAGLERRAARQAYHAWRAGQPADEQAAHQYALALHAAWRAAKPRL
jgi:hypothetical protein